MNQHNSTIYEHADRIMLNVSESCFLETNEKVYSFTITVRELDLETEVKVKLPYVRAFVLRNETQQLEISVLAKRQF
jgi:hypothetical protein